MATEIRKTIRRAAAVAATASLGLALLGIGAPPAAASKAGSYVTAKIVNSSNTYSGCESARKRMSASIQAGPTTWLISSKVCYPSKHVSSIGTITNRYTYVIVYGYR